jgi:uncharacterized SAM-binding protein YcdF (DUF218 family)
MRACSVLLLVVVLAVTADSWLPAIGHWLAYPPNPQTADVIVIYGGGQERTPYGISLYQQGLAPELWHTGPADKRGSIVALILKQGLPPEKMQYLASDSTWEDTRAIVALAKQHHLRRILVVTSWYHSRRVMCVIKDQFAGSGIEVYSAVPPSSVGPNDWWKYAQSRQQVASELVKLPYYWLRYGMAPWSC